MSVIEMRPPRALLPEIVERCRTIIIGGAIADAERVCLSTEGSMSSKPSIKDLKMGDADAWRWFVDEFGGPINGYARRLGHPDPDEVSGATFEAVARRIASFEGGHRELRSFVFSIAHARIVDEIRRRTARPTTELQSDVEDSTASRFVGETDDLLGRALTSLTDEQRHLLHLRYTVGLSTRETSKAVGKSEVATRVALSRTISRLRNTMATLAVADDQETAR